jgi:hypothetical protein
MSMKICMKTTPCIKSLVRLTSSLSTTLISRREGKRSVGEIDPGAPDRWRMFYASTLLEDAGLPL